VFVGDLTTSAVTGLTMTTPFGPFEYKATYEFKIKSLTPKPLPIADAATDG
jgi:hypothetical protein